MFVLPIGHEQGSVRRLPWVTFGIMGICVLTLVYSFYPPTMQEQATELIDRLGRLFTDHPHVQIDEEVADFLFAGMDEDTRQAFLEMHRTTRPREESSGRMEEIQREFDRLVGELMALAEALPLRRWGLVPKRPAAETFVTHMFMHAGVLHLLGNFLILYLAGPFVEDVWGRGLYAGFYVAAGLAAAIVFMVKHPELNVPLVGASGAIAGVMGAFLVRYWNTHIHFFYIFGFMFSGTFSAPAWVMLPMWFVEQLLMASLSSASMPAGGVAYWAHIGGFTFGVGTALVIRHYRVEERYINAKLDAVINKTLVDNSVVDEALETKMSGNPDRAFAMLHEEVRRQPRNRDVMLALWSVALGEKRLAEAAPVFLAMIRQELRAGDTRSAIEHWLDLVERVPDVRASPMLLVRLAQVLSGSGHQDEAAAALRLALLDADGAMTAATALRIAREAESVDHRVAQGAARMILGMPGISEVERSSAETLLTALSARSRLFV